MHACDILAYTYDGSLLCPSHGSDLETSIKAECEAADDGSSVSDVLGVVFADSTDLSPLEWCDNGHAFCGRCGSEYLAEETPSSLDSCYNCGSCFGCGMWDECECEPDRFDAIVNAYAEAAVWTSTDYPADATEEDREGNPSSLESLGYSVLDLPDDVLEEMRADVLDFWRGSKVDLEGISAESIGHDFWLSRNGHGAGFFDRGHGARGDRLQKAARTYGESNLLIGDDGALYLA